MTISTYSELKLAVQNWLGRDDIADARVSEFVALFEAVANRVLRVRQMEKFATLTTTAGIDNLPSDYLSWRMVKRTGTTVSPLEYITPEFAQAAFSDGASGTARYFTIVGDLGFEFQVFPIEDGNFGLNYWQKIPALSDNAATNWLLTAHPDLYLYGSLVEAEMFLVNDERALSWKSRRDELFEEVSRLSNKSRGDGAVRVLGLTP